MISSTVIGYVVSAILGWIGGELRSWYSAYLKEKAVVSALVQSKALNDQAESQAKTKADQIDAAQKSLSGS